MKRFLPLLALAFAAPSFSSAVQAQGQTPMMPTETAPIDAQAMALLDQSAAAYKALQSLSMHFTYFDSKGEATRTGSGTVSVERPARARVTLTLTPQPTQPFTTDFASAKTADDAFKMLQSAMMAIPTGASVPLVFLINGENPLSGSSVMGASLKWSKVKVLPDNGVSMTTSFGPGQPPITFSLYFDATDHLLRRVEAKLMVGGKPLTNITTLSQVEINPTFATGTFSPVAAPSAVTPAKPAAEPVYYDPKLVPGFAPYALTGADLSGKTISIPDYAGKVVLLDFWATWCGPCIGELPNVLANYKKYHDQGFDIVGISLDQSKESLTKFIAARQMPWPQLFDGNVWKNVNSTRYGVRAIPFTLLIGKDGKIAAVNPRGEELEPALKKALAG